MVELSRTNYIKMDISTAPRRLHLHRFLMILTVVSDLWFLSLYFTKARLTANRLVRVWRHSNMAKIHCKKNLIYVFLFWELRGLSLNSHIHVSVSDLYIPRIGPHISLQQIR